MSKLVEAAIEIALSQEGVREESENRGPRVDAYLRAAGVGPGNPWCAAFVYWCIEQAAGKLALANPFPRTAYCPDILNWANERDLLTGSPEPGDVFLRIGEVGGETRACHTGFVTHTSGDHFGTIEGNTNIDGSREGIGVFLRSRPISGSYKFVRWSELAPDHASESYSLVLSGRAICDMPVVNGRSLCPVRLWGESLGFEVGWNNEEQVPTFDGMEVPTETTVIDGKAYAPIRDLARSAGLKMEVDAASRRVVLCR
jgi:hypothetical protein